MATVPTTHDFTDGIVTSSEDNAYIRDPIKFLLSPPRAMLRQTTLQPLTTGVAAALAFQAEDVDDDVDGVGGHDNAVNNTRYTARYPGRYLLGGGVGFVANVTGRRGCYWAVDGAAVNGSMTALPATAVLEANVPARAISVYLNTGDYVELVAFQESGGTLNTNVTTFNQPSMSVLWVGLT